MLWFFAEKLQMFSGTSTLTDFVPSVLTVTEFIESVTQKHQKAFCDVSVSIGTPFRVLKHSVVNVSTLVL